MAEVKITRELYMDIVKLLTVLYPPEETLNVDGEVLELYRRVDKGITDKLRGLVAREEYADKLRGGLNSV